MAVVAELDEFTTNCEELKKKIGENETETKKLEEKANEVESTTGKKMNGSEDEPSPLKDPILESPVLPTLESALRHGSLVEMAKEIDLYNAYLELIETLS